MPPVRKQEGFRRGSKRFSVDDGYVYHLNRSLKNSGWLSLRCVKYYKEACLGRAVVSRDMTQYSVTTPHSCVVDEFAWDTRELRNAILRRCDTLTYENIADVIYEEGSLYPRDVRMGCRRLKLRSSIQRRRWRKFPPIPQDLSQLDILLRSREFRHLTLTRDGKSYMYAGICGLAANRSRCLIFMSKGMKRLMGRTKHVFSDGTWDGRPAKPHCSQLFSVVTLVSGQVIPLCVVLMESRTKETYAGLFEALHTLVPDFQPVTVNCDFEDAQYLAWKDIFPNIRVRGCLYHYARDVSTYGQGLRLTNLIRTNHTVNSIVRSCLAIPLVPKFHLQNALASIILRASEGRHYNRLSQLFQYIYDEWVTKRCEVLSVYKASDRTNNAAESWNSTLQATMKLRRPNLYSFLRGLLNLEEAAQQNYFTLQRGQRTTRPRKKSAVLNDAAISKLSILLKRGAISMTEFLRRASMRLLSPYRHVYFPQAVHNI